MHCRTKACVAKLLLLISGMAAVYSGDGICRSQPLEDRTIVSTSSVGVAKQLEQLVLPGSKLTVAPMKTRHDPFVLRMVNVYPHGSDHRYDFEYYALEPGQYNVCEFLTRAAPLKEAGSSTDDRLPPIWVEAVATVSKGEHQLSALPKTASPWLTGYRTTWLVGGILWFLGLLAIVFVGRSKRVEDVQPQSIELSFADQLRPLVKAACERTLEPEKRAILERTLIAYWCDRLHMGAVSPAIAMSVLKGHTDAGPLLRNLEDWLHRPDSNVAVDLDELLKPYASVESTEVASMQREFLSSPGGGLK